MTRSLALKPLRLGAAVLGALLALSNLPVEAAELCPPAASLLGAWTEQDGEGQLRFEPDRVVLLEKGLLRVASILRREPCTLIVRDAGVLATWILKGEGHALQLDRGKGAIVLDRLLQVPSTLDVSPLPLPPPGPVPAETATAVARELAAREEREQDVLRSESQKRSAVLDENIRYLREVVARYGWIDIPRFGKAAAAAAILIVKHSSDLRLLQDALPVAERDARENGGGKELVSILVDEVLISTGHKQKYGTQLTEDAQGNPFVIPVEDLAKVDAYRKELGILPWADYLKKASQVFYGGAPIRIPGPEE